MSDATPETQAPAEAPEVVETAKPKINVLKRFTLSLPAPRDSRVPMEIHFHPGEQEVEEHVANHPFIKAGADGCIENAEAAIKRAEKAAEQARKLQAEADAANAAAEATMARMSGHTKVIEQMSEEEMADLNTPLNQLRAKSGKDIDKSKAKAK